MKSSHLFAAAAALVAVLALGNSGTDAYATHELERIEHGGGIAGLVSGTLPDATRAFLMDNTTRSNYGLFSVYRRPRTGEPDAVTVGVLWSFIDLRSDH